MNCTIGGPDPEPDSRLDPFRMGLARVYDERVLVGFLSTRVDVRREQVRGLLGRPSLVNPVEFIEWFFEMAEDWPKRHPDGWDDGWEHDVEIRGELREGQFVYPNGAPLNLMWVDVAEASVWEEHYAYSRRHEKGSPGLSRRPRPRFKGSATVWARKATVTAIGELREVQLSVCSACVESVRRLAPLVGLSGARGGLSILARSLAS